MALLAALFRKVSVPPGAGDELRALADRGSVVYVMRTSGWLNGSFVRWLARRLGLPAVRAIAGLHGFFRLLAGQRGRIVALRAASAERGSAVVFLRRPSTFKLKGVSAWDPFPELVAMQRQIAHPLFLVPTLFIWSRRAQHLKPSVFDVLFGSSEAPGVLATILGFLRNHRRAFVRFGKPIDLQAFVRGRAGDAPQELARTVRGVLSYHLGRETHAVLGPPFKEPARIHEEVLRDRRLRDEVARAGEGAAAEAGKHVRRIAARMWPGMFGVLRPVAAWIFHRIYDGIEVDERGFEAVERAAAAGPLVLCPGHKSHVDYVVLTYLFYVRGLLPPHVAAGENLAFWPFGSIARRCGAFFIRRSFRGDRLYGAVLRAYVKRLLRDGFPLEFFIEGGRSRTGKLLPPRIGLLSMIVDSWLDGVGESLAVVPVAIDYEKLAEAGSHVRELRGGEKKKENLGELVKARRVLRARHGRIYIQFQRPLLLREVAAERGGVAAVAADRPSFVRHLASRIAYDLNRAATVTPVGLLASALLADIDRAVPAGVLGARIALLSEAAAQQGARFSASLQRAPWSPDAPSAIADALELLVRDGLVRRTEGAGGQEAGPRYLTVRARRPELDYYRNNVIHWYAGLAIVATVERTSTDGDGAAARRRAQWLSRLLKRELTYRVGATFDEIYAETRAFMERLGVRGDPERLDLLASFLGPLLESYRAAAESLVDWRGGRRDDFVRYALARSAAPAAGRVQLPEAVNKATLENAAAWLEAEGAFERAGRRESGEEELAVAAAWREHEARSLAAEIDRCRPPLGRPGRGDQCASRV